MHHHFRRTSQSILLLRSPKQLLCPQQPSPLASSLFTSALPLFITNYQHFHTLTHLDAKTKLKKQSVPSTSGKKKKSTTTAAKKLKSNTTKSSDFVITLPSPSLATATLTKKKSLSDEGEKTQVNNRPRSNSNNYGNDDNNSFNHVNHKKSGKTSPLPKSDNDLSEFDQFFNLDHTGEIVRQTSEDTQLKHGKGKHMMMGHHHDDEKSMVKKQRRSEQFVKNIQLLRTFVKHSEYREALKLYQGPFKEQKLHIPIDDYIAFFHLISIKMPFSVTLSVYNRMKKEGVKPTLALFQYLMHACSEARVEPGSQHVLRAHKIITVDMVKWKVDRTVFIMNCFLKTCVNTLDAVLKYPSDFMQSGIRVVELCSMVEEAYRILKTSPWIDRRPNSANERQEQDGVDHDDNDDDDSSDLIIGGDSSKDKKTKNVGAKKFVPRGKGGIHEFSDHKLNDSSSSSSSSSSGMSMSNVSNSKGRTVNRADKYTYTLLIQFYSKVGDMKSAFSVFDEMKKHFEEQSSVAAMLTDPVSGILRKQSFDRKSRGDSRAVADTFIYNTLMNGFVQNKKDLFLVFELYREMIEQSEIQPTSHTFSLLLTTARIIHNTQREYLREEAQSSQTRQRPRTVVLTKFSLGDNDESSPVIDESNNFNNHRTLTPDQLLLLKEFRFDDKVLAIYQEMKMRLLDPEIHQRESEQRYGRELVRKGQVVDSPRTKDKLDAYLINQMAQSLAQGGHIDEASNLVMNILKPQFMLITPVTCVLLLRKVISKKCYSLEQFNTFAKPIMALMRDHMYTVTSVVGQAKNKSNNSNHAGGAVMMTNEDLSQIVFVMLKNFKSHAMILELCHYCMTHFKVKLPERVIEEHLPGALRVEMRQLYGSNSQNNSHNNSNSNNTAAPTAAQQQGSA